MIRAALVYCLVLPVLVLAMLVWSAVPVRVLDIRAIEAPQEVYKGSTVWLRVSYCKYMDVWPRSEPVALEVDGQLLVIRPIPVPVTSHALPGCGTNWVPAFVLPLSLPASMNGRAARARVAWTYSFWGRSITASSWTKSFVIRSEF